MTKVSGLSICPRCSGSIIRDGNANGLQRFKCKACGWRGTAPVRREAEEAQGIDRGATAKLRTRINKARGVQRYVVTAAQNATPVNKPFFETLLAYCRHNNAQLIVVPYRYKNPTSMWSAKAEHDDWWAPELVPYLLDRRVTLNPNLMLLADIKTQPTASSPLMGFDTITGSSSGIVGHPRVELVSVATPQAKLPKIMTTTGAVTQKNYIPSKAGKKAEHHHTFGACVVEVDGKRFHLRQINAARDGSFCDLDREYRGAKSERVAVEALVMGDTHEEFVDPDVVRATFEGANSIVATLRPKRLVWHDFHDFFVRNHHHRGEVFINYVKHKSGNDNVEKALRGSFAFLDRVSPKYEGFLHSVIVPSNHPDALARWVKETDPRSDYENCVFWAETFKAMCDGSEWTAAGPQTPDPFAYWGKKWLKNTTKTRFLARDESYTVHGIELGLHGDKGANGSRGSIKGFSRIGVKTITGHNHAPGIEGGAYRVGTNSRLRLGYNSGPSSWLHADCLVYKNGKRSLLFIIDGHWRA